MTCQPWWRWTVADLFTADGVRLLTSVEIAADLGVSNALWRLWVSRGKAPAPHVAAGEGGMRQGLWREDAIREWQQREGTG